MLARFLSGLPHGAYFGVGAVFAADLVTVDRRTWAVAMMLIGLSVANVIGVPVTTVLGQAARLAGAVPGGRADRRGHRARGLALGAVPARRSAAHRCSASCPR